MKKQGKNNSQSIPELKDESIYVFVEKEPQLSQHATENFNNRVGAQFGKSLNETVDLYRKQEEETIFSILEADR